jgi:transcriptional antiterminator Rof (Rho-off)
MKINKAKLLIGKRKDNSNYIGVKVKTFTEPETEYVYFFDKSAIQQFKEGKLITLTTSKSNAIKLEIAKKGDEKKLFLTYQDERIELRLDKFGNYSYFNIGEIVIDPFISEIANELKTSAMPENTGEAKLQSDDIVEPNDFPF